MFVFKTLAFANFANILKFDISEEQKYTYNFEHLHVLSKLDFQNFPN